ncbi:MAG: hypothetical protein ACREYF_04050 [Gammaproteobacteria bacterium]
MKHLVSTLLLLFLSVLVGEPVTNAATTVVMEDRVSLPPKEVVIRIQAGSLELVVWDSTLGVVLQVLGGQTALEGKLTEPALARCAVQAQLSAPSLREVIELLLNGFSYALYPTASGALGLTVLGACPSRQMVKTFNPNRSAMVLPQTTGAPAAEEWALPQGAEIFPEDEPSSLDELETLGAVEPSLSQNEEHGLMPTSQEDQSEAEQKLQDALFRRALAVLHSTHQHLKSEAIKSIANIKDDRVTETLIESATGTLDVPTEARTEALAALVQNTAEPGAIRTMTLVALRDLSQDPNPSISSAARRALKEIQRRDTF